MKRIASKMLRLSKILLAFSLVVVLAIPANAEITPEGTGIPYGSDRNLRFYGIQLHAVLRAQ